MEDSEVQANKGWSWYSRDNSHWIPLNKNGRLNDATLRDIIEFCKPLTNIRYSLNKNGSFFLMHDSKLHVIRIDLTYKSRWLVSKIDIL